MLVAPSTAAIDCGDPGTPTNGQRTLSSTTYNSVVTYTCDVGYTLQGTSNRICQSNGQWSESVPQCNCEFSVQLASNLFCCSSFLYCVIMADNSNLVSSCNHCLCTITAVCSITCQNDGTCIPPSTCACAAGWTGKECETGWCSTVYDVLTG